MSKKPSRKRKSGAAQRKRGKKSSLGIDQRSRDLLGLGSVAIGVFLGIIIYLGWSGGTVGKEAVSALALAFGKLKIVTPLALLFTGYWLVADSNTSFSKPRLIGLVLLFIGSELALSLNIFATAVERSKDVFWESAVLKSSGGAVGESALLSTQYAFGTFGSYIVMGFLLVAGALLITGTSLGRAASGLSATVRGTGNLTHSVLSKAKNGATVVVRKGSDLKTSKEAVADFDQPSDSSYFDSDPVTLYDAAQDTESEDSKPVEIETEETFDRDQEDDSPAEVDPELLTPQGKYRDEVLEDPDFAWKVPNIKFLKRSGKSRNRSDSDENSKIAHRLVDALRNFGVEAKVVGTVSGPHITRYELRLAPGIKVSKITQLKDDLAYALAATDIRILAPIPGKRAVGVEVPNSRRDMVHLGDVFTPRSETNSSPLTVSLGKDVSGKEVTADLAKMPHLLIAGTTGAGKSGCVNALLSSILLQASPREVRLVLVDPKQVELNHYESVPHLLTPVITNPRKAANALQNLVREMEERYTLMSISRARKLEELNSKRVKDGKSPLPYMLCVIDELADLMMVAPADVEDAIIRLAQKARAVGIHLVLATQSPRVDVITGMIKANVPSRIAFSVSSQTDSRVILDQNGAETLLGQGDMLFSPVGSSKLQRIQGAYIDETEIRHLTEWWRKQGEPEFNEDLLKEKEASEEDGHQGGLDPDEDSLLSEAAELVTQMQTASTSLLQRRLRVGYTRAGRLIDMLERRGIISGYEGAKPRQVLVTELELPRVLGDTDSTDLESEEDLLEDDSSLENTATAGS